MKLINARSPYIIEVNEAGSIASKVEVFLWNTGSTEPPAVWLPANSYSIGNTLTYGDNYYQVTVAGYTNLTPPTHTSGTALAGPTLTLLWTGSATSTGTKVYVLSKSNPSTTQTSTQYNISNFVKEYINNTYTAGVNTLAIDAVGNWVNVRVKRWKLVGTVYTLLDNTLYGAVNGYTLFMDLVNYAVNITTTPFLMGNASITYKVRNNTTNYLNLFVPAGTWNYVNATTGDSINVTTTDFSVIRMPIKNGANKLYNISGPTLIYTINGITEDEAKYTPSVCRFINKQGGWDFLTFYKAKVTNITTKETQYKLLPSALNYNAALGQYKTFNANGQQSIKLNTGWVDENHSVLIQDLLLSETVFLDDVPVIVKTQGFESKTSLQNKMISYDVEFDYAFDMINNFI